MFTPTSTDLLAILPEIILTLAAGLLLVVEAFMPKLRRHASELTLVAVLAALLARVSLPLPGEVWAGMLSIDRVASFVDVYILAAVFLTAWMAGPFFRRLDHDYGEFYSLLLLAAVGAMIMACSVDVLPLFLGLELLSILVTNNMVGEGARIGFGSSIAVVLLLISIIPITVFLIRMFRDEPL